MADEQNLPLSGLHAELGAKFVSFAGWSMPLQYASGVTSEHLWCRSKAALFDVSHMGQLRVPGDADRVLESLVPADICGLTPGRQRYGVLTNAAGGIRDDLMIARHPDTLILVVNAAAVQADLAHLQANIPDVDVIADRALLALQGPRAEAVLAGLVPQVAQMRFMDVQALPWRGAQLWVSRSGYTGEDGFEISVPSETADRFARALLQHPDCAPAGLGARDALRLEAGLPLCGQDLSADISPVEAGLAWSIAKVRRPGGARAGGFAGADVILDHLAHGPPRRRVGLRPEGRAPMRAGVVLYAQSQGGAEIGQITSGGYGPSLEGPMALGLVDASLPARATIWGEVRGKRLPARQVPLPFIPHRYKRIAS